LADEIVWLQSIFGKDNADKLLSFAMMRRAYQTPIKRLAYYHKLFDKLRSAELLAKISPKDVIEFSKSIYQTRVRGTWFRSEIASKTKKIFKKIEISLLT
jgi:hypothetical protein